jgi:hypothetical protein
MCVEAVEEAGVSVTRAGEASGRREGVPEGQRVEVRRRSVGHF